MTYTSLHQDVIHLSVGSLKNKLAASNATQFPSCPYFVFDPPKSHRAFTTRATNWALHQSIHLGRILLPVSIRKSRIVAHLPTWHLSSSKSAHDINLRQNQDKTKHHKKTHGWLPLERMSCSCTHQTFAFFC